MKLIDLLVQELPKRGGWPVGAEACAQDDDGDVCFYSSAGVHRVDGRAVWTIPSSVNCKLVKRRIFMDVADDRHSSIISRIKYEAALAASQQPAWNGVGLPPVGLQIEYTCNKFSEHNQAILEGYWYIGTVIAYYEGFVWTSDNGIRPLHNTKFRPIRTEAERKREEAIKEIIDCSAVLLEPTAGLIYDAIAAGKIPGVKLSD